MAHFILEYSANLDDELDVQALFKALHKTVLETGVFPEGGIRFRAVRCEEYLIADGNPANAFVHLCVKMGHGRSMDIRQTAGERIFSTLTTELQASFATRPMGISFAMQELDAVLNFKQNNLHEYINGKRGETGRE